MDDSEFEDLMRRQRMTLRSVSDESETDSKIKLMTIISSMVTDRNRKVQKEAVLFEAQSQGMSETEFERVISTLKEDHIIIEPEPGYVKLA